MKTVIYKEKEVYCFKSIYEDINKGKFISFPEEETYIGIEGEIYSRTYDLLKPLIGFGTLESLFLIISHNPKRWESLQSVYKNFNRKTFNFVFENQEYLGIKSSNI